MATVRSFQPVIRPDAKILILGSMPGKVSLAQQRYYAHPRNLFWLIMGELFGAGPELPYEQRLRALQENGVALWDVLQECDRASALDSDIVETTMIANNFSGLLMRNQRIRRIYFNGTKAEHIFKKHVLPGLKGFENIELTRLPSTSPANASIPLNTKMESWREIKRHI